MTISIHALREEGDERCLFHLTSPPYFYPRPPRGGRQEVLIMYQTASGISIHALREEGDLRSGTAKRWPGLFLSTPSARRATPPSGAGACAAPISIHALREEGDAVRPPKKSSTVYFYPRPPRGGRLQLFTLPELLTLFLSTPSARRATLTEAVFLDMLAISIHALREEGDRWFQPVPDRVRYFYPRPPRGGRLPAGGCGVRGVIISIHALREEGDDLVKERQRFNKEFLSTPSARRATLQRNDTIAETVHFYPRPPRGGRLTAGLKSCSTM